MMLFMTMLCAYRRSGKPGSQYLRSGRRRVTNAHNIFLADGWLTRRFEPKLNTGREAADIGDAPTPVRYWRKIPKSHYPVSCGHPDAKSWLKRRLTGNGRKLRWRGSRVAHTGPGVRTAKTNHLAAAKASEDLDNDSRGGCANVAWPDLRQRREHYRR